MQWWFEFDLPSLKERRIPAGIQTSRLIPVLVGPRRSGKSAIFFLIIKRLLKAPPLSNIIYLNFEDDRLYPLNGSELTELLPVYKQNFSWDSHKPLYLFLDEIQNLPNWEKIVRRLYETESSLKLFITGSNARMLSFDIATSLRGRTL